MMQQTAGTYYSMVSKLNLSRVSSTMEAEDPDILILTETKVSINHITPFRRGSRRRQVNDEPVDPTLTSRFPYRYWLISEKKTYCMLSH
jgi:hypothetical protein